MLAHFHQIYTTNGGGAEGEEGDGLKLTRNICRFSITRGKIVGRVSLFYPTWFPFIRIYIFIYLFLRDNVIKSDLWKSAVTTVCITAWGEGGGRCRWCFSQYQKISSLRFRPLLSLKIYLNDVILFRFDYYRSQRYTLANNEIKLIQRLETSFVRMEGCKIVHS